MSDERTSWKQTDNTLTMRLYNLIAEVTDNQPGAEAAIALGMNLIDCYRGSATKVDIQKFIGALWDQRPGRPN